MRKELTTVGFCERDIKTMKAFGIGTQMEELHAELMSLPDIKDTVSFLGNWPVEKTGRGKIALPGAEKSGVKHFQASHRRWLNNGEGY